MGNNVEPQPKYFLLKSITVVLFLYKIQAQFDGDKLSEFFIR